MVDLLQPTRIKSRILHDLSVVTAGCPAARLSDAVPARQGRLRRRFAMASGHP